MNQNIQLQRAINKLQKKINNYLLYTPQNSAAETRGNILSNRQKNSSYIVYKGEKSNNRKKFYSEKLKTASKKAKSCRRLLEIEIKFNEEIVELFNDLMSKMLAAGPGVKNSKIGMVQSLGVRSRNVSKNKVLPNINSIISKKYKNEMERIIEYKSQLKNSVKYQLDCSRELVKIQDQNLHLLIKFNKLKSMV